MTIKINYKIYLITLTSVAALTYEPRVERPIEMELLTKGVYTCVNTERDMTCFGGELPTEWDGVSMPDASIVLHRVGQKARVVSEFTICTDRGECFGDPIVGIEAAKVVLRQGKLICQSIFSDEESVYEEGRFSDPCVGFQFVCARHAEDGSKISCWDNHHRGCSVCSTCSHRIRGRQRLRMLEWSPVHQLWDISHLHRLRKTHPHV